MKSERGNFGMALIFAVLFATLAFVSIGCASAATIYVPDDYAKIQWAIDNATAGETIMVNAFGGPYYENVVVSQQLTLIGIGLPEVNASGIGSAITVRADGCLLRGFNATGGGDWWRDAGIKVESDNNVIQNNTANSNNNCGIFLYSSSNNNLTDNIVNSNSYGICIYSSSNNNLTNNTMADNSYNFVVYAWSLSDFTQNIGTSNTVDGKPIYYLVSEKDQIIDSTSNAGYVAVVNSTNITVKDLTLEKNYQGVLFAYTSNPRIENISASSNYYGFYLRKSDNNNLTNNIANSNYYGIYLYRSSNSKLTNNTMADNNYNFGVGGWSLSDFTQNIDTSNTVDGKPICYLVSEKDQIIDSTSNAGYVAIVNSTNVTAKDLTLEKNYQGVLFAYTANSRIENVSASNNNCGINLWYSDNNNLTDNNASSNRDRGIYLCSSDNNNLTDDNASSNHRGIELWYSDNNNLTDNTVTSNKCGFWLTSSSINNTIANNSIHNNTQYNFHNDQSDNVTAEYNWWGTTDTDAINASIYDYYDDASNGIVDYVPYLTEPPVRPPATPAPTPTPEATTVSISPSTKTVSPGPFTVNVTVEPEVPIAGVQFDLSFDPSLVRANNVTEGNLLKQGGANTYFYSGTIDNAAGTITGVASAITTPGETVSTPAVLATIQMTAKSAAGTSTLDFSNVIVGDVNGNAVATTVNDGSVTISTAPWDVNGDGFVNVLDMISVGQHFGETGSPGWIPEDVNRDGVIDVRDMLP